MKLGIVIPVLNDAEPLARLLGDLRRFAADAEIVVADGGSSDDSLAVAKDGAHRVCSAPRGRAAQMQAGADRVRSDWLWFLHADSRLRRMDAAELATAARAPDRPGWGFCRVHLDGALPALRIIESAMNARSSWTGIATGDQGIFVHRQLLDAIGGIPPLPLMEDIELCRRLRRLAHPKRLRGPIETSARRWRRDGVARTVALMWSLRLRYFLGADPADLARRYYPGVDR